MKFVIKVVLGALLGVIVGAFLAQTVHLIT